MCHEKSRHHDLPRVAFQSSQDVGAQIDVDFGTQSLCLAVPLPWLHPTSYLDQRTTQGQSFWLRILCKTLSFSIPNRFNPALSGHLHKNLLAPCAGVGNGPSRAIRQWQDDDATEIIKTIESSPTAYPYTEKYGYWPGPNSNTFVQWVLRDRMRLGIRAVGKLYPVPEIAG